MKDSDKLIGRRKVLFFAEAVTLAHAARPVVLGKSLDPKSYDVHLAWDSRFQKLFPGLDFTIHQLHSISCDQFLKALAKGSPVYTADTLREYVTQDLELIDAVCPDLIVGDFRLSLAVSARIANVPYVTITNAYWSPYFHTGFPLPEHPMTKVFGVALSQALFNMTWPLIFAYHCLPLNRIRKYYGQSSLGYDLRRIYTEADYTLYADIPDLIKMSDLPENHQFIGPVLWSPSCDLPNWWDDLPENKPLIYVTLGSSGQGGLLPVVLEALAELPVTVIAATAGRQEVQSKPKNAFVTEFLPGEEASARANLVVCNGGSPTTQQALTAGVPVLGIATNMDQHLNMNTIESAGVGILLRAGKADWMTVRSLVRRLLADTSYTENAKSIAAIYPQYRPLNRFSHLIGRI